MTVIRAIAFASLTLVAVVTTASAQTGPVATTCKADIAKLCANKAHDGAVRICLESNYDALAGGCKTALDTTGGGRGKMFGKAK